MTAADNGQPIVLTGKEAAFVRQALAACSLMLSLAVLGGPGREVLEEAARLADDSRPLGKVHYDVCLAIDYIDFARPAGSTR